MDSQVSPPSTLVTAMHVSAFANGTPPAPPALYTNQQVINAFFNAGDRLGIREGALLRKVGLNFDELAADPLAPYRGADIDQMEGLNTVERLLIKQELRDQLLARVLWTGYVNAPAGLHLRAGPAPHYPSHRILPDRTPVQVLDDSQSWHFVLVGSQAGYVFGEWITRAGQEAPPADHGGDSPLMRTWLHYQDILAPLAERLQIDPAVAVAVLMAESGGKGFGADGRMIIRFENHVFYQEWGKAHPEQFARHFQFDPQSPWVGERHFWRAVSTSPWRTFHGNQHAEWEVFNFARGLDQEAALRSISMGAPQIMGFNHRLLGYGTVQEMFQAFQSSEQSQIEGLFRFIEGKNLVAPLRAGDYLTFARSYNGPRQAQQYASMIERYVDAFNQSSGAQRGGGAISVTAAPEPQTRAPLPLSPEQTGGMSLDEYDPELYAAWRTHVMQGFENNSTMFNSILRGFMNPYYTTIWMYRILFTLGIAAFCTAAVLAYLFRETPAVAAGASLVFGGLSVTSFLAFFISHPLRSLERNLHFIAWLGIVYNSYWTRLAYARDPETFADEVEKVTDTTVREIERIIDKHTSLQK